ncbi:MAG: hypothetical protein JWM62_53 [Frankiales bacterium]|jgi:hypothetical protein|nr:hypothetical protein [Frankiales bacterium]
MKRIALVLSAALIATVPVLVTGPAASAATCRTSWGSTPETRSTGSTGQLTNIRAGRHACFDRLVLDVSGDARGYFVRYVDQVRRDGSGAAVPLRGGAHLEVVVTAPARPTDAWFLPNGELLDPTGYRTFRHLAWAGSFEGQSALGLGVRARLPFRVLLLDGPGTGSRLVVDVAHRW